MYFKYPEYHTSLDDKNFISETALRETVGTYLQVIDVLELNDHYINTKPHGEPHLSKHGLYPTLGAEKTQPQWLYKILNLLAFSDGNYDLIDIANRMNLLASDFHGEVSQLMTAGLLKTSRAETAPGQVLSNP